MKTYDIDDTLLLAKELHPDAMKNNTGGYVVLNPRTTLDGDYIEGANTIKFDPLADSTCVALQEWLRSTIQDEESYIDIRGDDVKWHVNVIFFDNEKDRMITTAYGYGNTINEAVASVVLAIIKGRE